MLGKEKYSEALGISTHQAAAYVCARRAQGHDEIYEKPEKKQGAKPRRRRCVKEVPQKKEPDLWLLADPTPTF